MSEQKNEQPKERRDNKFNLPASSAGGLAFSANVIIYLLLTLVAAGIISVAKIAGTDGAKYLALLASPLAIVITAIIVTRLTRAPVTTLLPVKTKPKYLLIGLLLIIGLFFSLSWVNGLIVKLFALMGYAGKESALPDMSGVNVIPALIVIAAVPAVAEEALFRGIMLNCSRQNSGDICAVLLTGFCFSIYHGSVEQTLYQFACGCLFGLLAVRSRSVTPTVLIHFLNNAVIILLNSFGLIDAVTGEILMPLWAEIVSYSISAICLIGAVVWLVLDKTELEKRRSGGVKNFFIGASVGIAAMVALWIGNLF